MIASLCLMLPRQTATSLRVTMGSRWCSSLFPLLVTVEPRQRSRSLRADFRDECGGLSRRRPGPPLVRAGPDLENNLREIFCRSVPPSRSEGQSLYNYKDSSYNYGEMERGGERFPTDYAKVMDTVSAATAADSSDCCRVEERLRLVRLGTAN